MARTAVTYSDFVANSSLAMPAGANVDPTNDHVINNCEPERTVLRVTNTHGSDHNVIIKAGAKPPAMAAGQGDLTVTVPATTGDVLIGPLESGRFLQVDGTLLVDLPDAAHTGKITAFKIPRTT